MTKKQLIGFVTTHAVNWVPTSSAWGKITRQDMVESVCRYVREGQAPGHFLTSVLTNDLREAVGRADSTNMADLQQWVTAIYSDVPSIAWGSEENVKNWISTHAKARVHV